MPRPPEGTIALLFTDIEGSTRLAMMLGEAWSSVLADHHALIRGAIEAEGGFVDGTEATRSSLLSWMRGLRAGLL